METATPTELEVIEQLRLSISKIDGLEQFTNAAKSFVKGEIDSEEAISDMMSFLRGDIAGNKVERERLIQLAHEIGPECGTVSISILTFTACTPAFSCSAGCC